MKICWNLTNKCNSSCNHCFRNLKEPPLDNSINFKILNNIKGIVDSISFSGGEVLLYDGFYELLKKSNSLGFKNSITTNASLLNESNFLPYIKLLDRITFSIDYIENEKNLRNGRGEKYCEHVSEVIKLIKNYSKDFPIKINTVITKQNINDIDDIYEFIKNNGINSWKLMRFCPYREIAKNNASNLEISDEEFLSIQNKIRYYDELNVVVEDIGELEEQIFISPSGNLTIGQDNEDIVILPSLYEKTPQQISKAIENKLSIENKLNINLNFYKAFYTVAKSESISVAAKKLFISQPALSKAIKNIENVLNIKLFNRNINGTTLTPEGNKLLHYVEIALNNISIAERMIKEEKYFSKGYLKIGAPSHLGTFMIFEKVQEFRKNFPNINISIISRSSKELMQKLHSHDVDFIIDSGPINTDEQNLTIKHLTDVRHCFCCSKNFIENNKFISSLLDLQFVPLILPVEHSTHRKELNLLCESQGVSFKNVLNIETSEMTLNAINQNLGIGYILYNLVKDDINKGKLVEISIKETLPQVPIYLIYNKEFMTSVPEHFIKKYILNN